MKATIQSTERIVTMADVQGNHAFTRVFEGVTERGVPFVAYIMMVQVKKDADNAEFERDLSEHKQASPETLRAIDLRFVL